MTANLPAQLAPAFGEPLRALRAGQPQPATTSAEKVAEDYGFGPPTANPKIKHRRWLRLEVDAGGARFDADRPVLYARFDAGTPFRPAARWPWPRSRRITSSSPHLLEQRGGAGHRRRHPGRALGGELHGGRRGRRGSRSISARQVAFVDNAFDGSVSRLDLSLARDAASAPKHPALETRVRLEVFALFAGGQAGRKLFYDATNPT